MIDDEPNTAGGDARRQPSLPESRRGREALAWLEDGQITLGRFRVKLEDAPVPLHGPLLDYFSLLTELAGAETRMALDDLSRRVRDGATRPRHGDVRAQARLSHRLPVGRNQAGRRTDRQ